MSDLRSLYQEVILDHNRRPRNYGALDEPNSRSDGYNPLCGDKVSVYVRLDDGDSIESIGFEGSGCAISTASASLMTEAVAGKSRQEALALQDRFHRLLTGLDEPTAKEDLGKLEALAGVRDYPVRIKCATLAWHALKRALEGVTGSESVTTGPVTTE